VSSLLNAGVDNKLLRLRTGNFKRHCHFRSEVYSMVESKPKDEITIIEREKNYSFLESSITVPLHST